MQWILAVILLSSVLILSIIKQDFNFLGIMATNVSAIMACEDLTNIYAKLFFKKRSFAFRYVFHFFKCAFYFSSIVELFFEINDNLNYASMLGSIFTVIGAIFIIGELLIRKYSFVKMWYIFYLFFSPFHSILDSGRKQVFAMKCELEPAINNCPFYIKSSRTCTNESVCSFQEKKNTQKQYIRKERWYEKYYKK